MNHFSLPYISANTSITLPFTASIGKRISNSRSSSSSLVWNEEKLKTSPLKSRSSATADRASLPLAEPGLEKRSILTTHSPVLSSIRDLHLISGVWVSCPAHPQSTPSTSKAAGGLPYFFFGFSICFESFMVSILFYLVCRLLLEKKKK